MPDAEISLNILAIHAHPDDVEFQCAGTLALLAAAGHKITIVTMTPGDCGSKELGPHEIAAVRRQEAIAAAAILGAACECLEFRDLSIVVNKKAKRRVTECIRRCRPHLVFTAPPVDYMDDHEATSRLVRDACFNAGCPNYRTGKKSADSKKGNGRAATLDWIPHLYYVDPVEGVDLFGQPIRPHFWVDATSTFDIKRRMLACHESQRGWLRAQHGVDEYLDSQERWSARRGAEIGLAHAEAFRQHVGHPYHHDNLLERLLPDYVKKPT